MDSHQIFGLGILFFGSMFLVSIIAAATILWEFIQERRGLQWLTLNKEK